MSFCCKVCDFYAEEFHLFEDDILLTRDDLMLFHLLLPPGEAFDEANGLDSEITEDGFMPFQEKRPIQQVMIFVCRCFTLRICIMFVLKVRQSTHRCRLQQLEL